MFARGTAHRLLQPHHPHSQCKLQQSHNDTKMFVTELQAHDTQVNSDSPRSHTKDDLPLFADNDAMEQVHHPHPGFVADDKSRT